MIKINQELYEQDKKKEQIEKINQEAYNEIIAKYPLWKQINITRNREYNSKEFEEMIQFIDNVRVISDEKTKEL